MALDLLIIKSYYFIYTNKMMGNRFVRMGLFGSGPSAC